MSCELGRMVERMISQFLGLFVRTGRSNVGHKGWSTLNGGDCPAERRDCNDSIVSERSCSREKSESLLPSAIELITELSRSKSLINSCRVVI